MLFGCCFCVVVCLCFVVVVVAAAVSCVRFLLLLFTVLKQNEDVPLVEYIFIFYLHACQVFVVILVLRLSSAN